MHKIVSFILAGACLVSLGVGADESTAPQFHKASAKKTEVALLKSIEAGDVACYVTLVDAKGQETTQMADFAICEMNQLVGRRVQIRRIKANVMAESCQGNPDCKETESVNLISRVKALP